MSYQRGRRSISPDRRSIWRPEGRPKGAPGVGMSNQLKPIQAKLGTGLAPPDPQQPIGYWLWLISVEGVVFYVAGVVFGGKSMKNQ